MQGSYLFFLAIIFTFLGMLGFSIKRKIRKQNYIVAAILLAILSSYWFFDADPTHLLVRFFRDETIFSEKDKQAPSIDALDVSNNSQLIKNSTSNNSYFLKSNRQSDSLEVSETKKETTSFSIYGRWTGEIKQPNSTSYKTYRVKLIVTKKNNKVLFETFYPELNCHGVGYFKGNAKKDITYNETIGSGKSKCIDGKIGLIWITKDTIFFNWENGVATGTLKKT